MAVPFATTIKAFTATLKRSQIVWEQLNSFKQQSQIMWKVWWTKKSLFWGLTTCWGYVFLLRYSHTWMSEKDAFDAACDDSSSAELWLNSQTLWSGHSCKFLLCAITLQQHTYLNFYSLSYLAVYSMCITPTTLLSHTMHCILLIPKEILTRADVQNIFFFFTLNISNSSRFRFKIKTLDPKGNWKW